MRRPVWAATLNLRVPPPAVRCSEAAGRFAQIVKCARIWLVVSCSPQPQPHFISGPAGRPRLTFKVPRRRSMSSEAAGLWLAVSLAPQRQPHGIRGPGGLPLKPSASSPRGPHGRRPPPLRAYGQVCAHHVAGELATAAPAAEHPQPSRASVGLESRSENRCPNTHLAPSTMAGEASIRRMDASCPQARNKQRRRGPSPRPSMRA
jgi:hypothetical protein